MTFYDLHVFRMVVNPGSKRNTTLQLQGVSLKVSKSEKRGALSSHQLFNILDSFMLKEENFF